MASHPTVEPSIGGRRFRITELARDAGLSIQQIRNYVTLGLLPPAERAPNGYRIFTARHAEALTTARTVIAGHGWQTAVTMLRAVHDDDPTTALAEVDRGHAELDRERTQVAAMLEALDGELPQRLRVHHPLRVGDAAAAVGVRPSTLRLWEQHGLLTPDRERGTLYRRYDQGQVIRARIITMLRRSGYPLPAVREVVSAMQAGDPARTRTALTSRQRELNEASVRRARATAALYLYIERYLPVR
jgi:DNA-binding transcriptional MerR regulator